MSRMQLALNVDNLDEAVTFYSKLFNAEPAKLKEGYANFAIAEPPLKLVLLQNPGNVLILFPEGTRTTTGAPGRFKPGIGLLLAGTSIPVVPCFLEGAYAAWLAMARMPQAAQSGVWLTPWQPQAWWRLWSSMAEAWTGLGNAALRPATRKAVANRQRLRAR